MTDTAAPSEDWANALTDFVDEIGGDGPGLWKWAGITPTTKEVVDELRLLFKHSEQRATASGARSVLKFDPQDRDESIRLAWGGMTSDQAVKGLKALVGHLNGLAAPPVPQTPAPGAEFFRPTMDEVMRLAKTFGVEVNDCHALMWLVVTSIAAWGDGPKTPSTAPVAWCRSDDFLNALIKRQSFSGWREQHPDCDMPLYAHPQASTAPDADQAERPSLADVDELCAEFGFHLDDSQGEGLGILHDMITAALTRWRAPVTEALQLQEKLSMGKLVSERIQELLDEVAQRGLEPDRIVLGVRAEQLLRKEVRKSLLLQYNANQDNPLPQPKAQDRLFVFGVEVNKSDVEAAEYVAIECYNHPQPLTHGRTTSPSSRDRSHRSDSRQLRQHLGV